MIVDVQKVKSFASPETQKVLDEALNRNVKGDLLNKILKAETATTETQSIQAQGVASYTGGVQ
jgi:hypothetical protein